MLDSDSGDGLAGLLSPSQAAAPRQAITHRRTSRGRTEARLSPTLLTDRRRSSSIAAPFRLRGDAAGIAHSPCYDDARQPSPTRPAGTPLAVGAQMSHLGPSVSRCQPVARDPSVPRAPLR